MPTDPAVNCGHHSSYRPRGLQFRFHCFEDDGRSSRLNRLANSTSNLPDAAVDVRMNGISVSTAATRSGWISRHSKDRVSRPGGASTELVNRGGGPSAIGSYAEWRCSYHCLGQYEWRTGCGWLAYARFDLEHAHQHLVGHRFLQTTITVDSPSIEHNDTFSQ